MDDPTPVAIGRLAHARALKELTHSLRDNRAATASGLWGSSVAAVTAALERELHRPILLVCGHIDEADDLADDQELFHHRRPDILPALELSGSLGQVSEEQASNRLQLLARLATTSPSSSLAPVLRGEGQGEGSAQSKIENRKSKIPLIVAPIQSL